MRLQARSTAVVAVDMHRGHLDPLVATLPLAAERCGPVIARAAELFRQLRAIGLRIIHVVTEYRESGEIAANPFWKAIHDDPTKARKGILRHNLAGSHGTEIIAPLYTEDDLVVRGKKRYSAFYATDLEFLLRRLGVDTLIAQALHPDYAFDLTMLTPVTQVATGPVIVAARKSFPVNTLGDVISYAKANPHRLEHRNAQVVPGARILHHDFPFTRGDGPADFRVDLACRPAARRGG